MLYVTTRNAQEHYTPAYTLRDSRSKDGGFFVPFHVPVFSDEEIRNMHGAAFGQCVAEVINRLFQTQLTGWDIEFAIGRYPVRLRPLGHRIWVAETWHNIHWNFDHVVSKIAALIDKNGYPQSAWVGTAVRAAVLFGIYSELSSSGSQPMDVSVASREESFPMSVWYARQWGLPIGNIVCSCSEDSGIWNLITYGQMRMGEGSGAAEADQESGTLDSVEQLLFVCGGSDETAHFLDSQKRRQLYTPTSDTVFNHLQQGVFASPVSKQRIMDTIPAVFRTHGCLIDPVTSWAYSGLLDYRARTGIIRPSVIISENSPVYSISTITEATGFTEEEVRRILDM